MNEINVLTTIKPKAGKEKEVEDLLAYLVTETHKETGCLRYSLHRLQSNPSTYILMEKWASEKDMQAHFQTPHIMRGLQIKDQIIDVLDIAPLIPVQKSPTGKSAL
jgi:quinol monooxygenase YgiN